MPRIFAVVLVVLILSPATCIASSFTFDWTVERFSSYNLDGDFIFGQDDTVQLKIIYHIDNFYEVNPIRYTLWPVTIQDGDGAFRTLMDGTGEGEGSIHPSDAGPDIMTFHFSQWAGPLNYILHGEIWGVGSPLAGQLRSSEFYFQWQDGDRSVYASGAAKNFSEKLPVPGQTPEPASLLLLGSAACACWIGNRRRRRG